MTREYRMVNRQKPKCGTYSGYAAHRRAGTDVCNECRMAARLYEERRRREAGIPPRGKAECGTASGYEKHRRRGERQCDPCRLAWNARCRDYQREARRKAKETE